MKNDETTWNGMVLVPASVGQLLSFFDRDAQAWRFGLVGSVNDDGVVTTVKAGGSDSRPLTDEARHIIITEDLKSTPQAVFNSLGRRTWKRIDNQRRALLPFMRLTVKIRASLMVHGIKLPAALEGEATANG